MTPIPDKDLLEMKIGGIALRDYTAAMFLQWLNGKLDGAPAYRAETQELILVASSVPMSRKMPDDEKIRLIRKLEALNIPIV